MKSFSSTDQCLQLFQPQASQDWRRVRKRKKIKTSFFTFYIHTLTDKIRTSKYMLLKIISLHYLMSQGILFLQRRVSLQWKITPTNPQTTKHQTAKTCWQLCTWTQESYGHTTGVLFDVFKALSVLDFHLNLSKTHQSLFKRALIEQYFKLTV